ncbi:MAG: ParB/RepB/Spo0J family partition protein [Deltaproteobacteria bacterium]
MRQALGKGIGALIPNAPARQLRPDPRAGLNAPPPVAMPQAPSEETPRGDHVRMLEIDSIVPNPRQPRSIFSEDDLADLTRSIVEQGILQPILVRTGENGKFELIAGERRWRASQRANLSEIPALVRELADEESLVVALIENVQRADLGPIEEATAFQALIDEFVLTQDEVAQRVGKSRPAIANSLRLLKLPAATQKELEAGRITVGHARALLGIENDKARETLTAEIVNRNLSVRDTEKAARATRHEPAKSKRDPDVVLLEDELTRVLGTPVGITTRGSVGKGKVEISFFSNDDLGRLSDILLAAGRRATPLN